MWLRSHRLQTNGGLYVYVRDSVCVCESVHERQRGGG